MYKDKNDFINKINEYNKCTLDERKALANNCFKITSKQSYANKLEMPVPTHYLSMWPFYIDIKPFENIDINSLQNDLFGEFTPFEYVYYSVLCGQDYTNTNIGSNINGCLRVTSQKQFDIIFLDPPFDTDILNVSLGVISNIYKHDLMRNVIIYFENKKDYYIKRFNNFKK